MHWLVKQTDIKTMIQAAWHCCWSPGLQIYMLGVNFQLNDSRFFGVEFWVQVVHTNCLLTEVISRLHKLHKKPVWRHPLIVQNALVTPDCSKNVTMCPHNSVYNTRTVDENRVQAHMLFEGWNQQKCAILCFPNQGKLYILTLSFQFSSTRL
jgi:hypothetical protein